MYIWNKGGLARLKDGRYGYIAEIDNTDAEDIKYYISFNKDAEEWDVEVSSDDILYANNGYEEVKFILRKVDSFRRSEELCEFSLLHYAKLIADKLFRQDFIENGIPFEDVKVNNRLFHSGKNIVFSIGTIDLYYLVESINV